MRKILFRGKTVDTGEWWYGDFCHENEQVFIRRAVIDDTYYECYSVFPETVGQYTGLTDKNGKKIFEGDIVKYSETITTRSRGTETLQGIYEVVCEPCFLSPFDCISVNHCEVIGNIHDNPELLEGGEE